jgi:Ca-activated chloride channel family protein
VSNFFARVNYPVLSDLKVDFGGVETDMMYPRALGDLFKNSQLVLVGRYKNSMNSATVRLTGKMGEREQVFAFTKQSFPQERGDNAFLGRLWATRRVGYLLEQVRLNGENRELKDEIVQLGTRYGIVTPYTSFLVTEDMKDIAAFRNMPPAERRRLNEMVSVAPGVASGGAAMRTGESAVVYSQAERALKDTDRIAGPESYSTSIRGVGDKTFQLRGEVWIDTEFKDSSSLPKLEVQFGSEAFFNLIANEPELAEYFSLGKKVTVVYKGRIYRVT